MFGKLLKEKCEKMGVTCYFVCSEVKAEIDEIAFLRRVFGME